MSDFIREVDEDYRRERFTKFLSRYQVPLVLAVILIILGSGVWRWWQDSQVSAAEKENVRFAQAVDLATAGKDAEAEAAFAAIAKDGPAGFALLARMRDAAVIAKTDPEAGAQAFDVIASEDSLPASMRDTARFRGALLRVDRDDPKAFESRYGRFSIGGFAYHNSIRELLALTAVKRGDSAAALRYLDDIITDPSAPSAMRNRAEAFRLLATSGAAVASKTQAPPAEVVPVTAAASVAPSAAPPPAPPAPAPAATPAAAAQPVPPAGANPTAIKPTGPKPTPNAAPD